MSVLGVDLIKSKLPFIPKSAGIYKMLSKSEVIYVGKAKNLYKRLYSYTRPNLLGKVKTLVSNIEDLEFISVKSEEDALLLEVNLIKKYFPKYNVLFKDDKTFSYIKVGIEHSFPKITKYRSKKVEKGCIYGPFSCSISLNSMLSNLQKIFKLRTCSDYYFANRKRACIQHEIKRCTAPCVDKISREEYAQDVKHAKLFLEGKSLHLQKVLSEKMQEYSDNLEYEKAADIRDKIQQINFMQVRSSISKIQEQNYDIIGFASINNHCCIKIFTYRMGQNYGDKVYFCDLDDRENSKEYILESFLMQTYQSRTIPDAIFLPFVIQNNKSIKNAIEQLKGSKLSFLGYDANNEFAYDASNNAVLALQNKLAIKAKNLHQLQQLSSLLNMKSIDTIEVYDNSHIMGNYAVGAVVVANVNGFIKSKFRTYKISDIIKNPVGGDDYAMLREVLTRRKKVFEEDKPSLIIIDGGKGHLNVALEVLKEFLDDIKVISMSKGKDRSGGELFHQAGIDLPFTLLDSDPLMQYLQNLRDEVHNLAINTYRKKHLKSIYSSSLDNIEGIGPSKKQVLLNYFGSIENIKNSDIKTLSKVPGISRELASRVLELLNRS